MDKFYNIDACDVNALINDIFQYLQHIENETGKGKSNKYYFNGEGDSNQTKYELLGNTLRICVVAKEQIVAKCLHHFLRSIIDNSGHAHFLSTYSLEFSEEKELTVKKIVELMAHDVESYFHEYDPYVDGLNATNILRNGTKITRYICDISGWSIYRIAKHMGVDLEEFPDVD